MEVNDNASVDKVGAIFLTQYRSATRGQYDIFPLCQPIDYLAFPPPKIGFPLQFEEQTDGRTGVMLDLTITIDKLLPQGPGKLAPYRGFARTHGADQKDVRWRHVNGFLQVCVSSLILSMRA